MKNHLKRLAIPKTWHLKRKETKWITRPKPGAHPISMGMSLSVFMRKLAKVAKTSKEVKNVLNTKEVLVDGAKRKDPRMPVGLMDSISFPQINEHYRVLLDFKGRLTAVSMSGEDAKTKLSRVESKTLQKKGKVQLNMSDGRSLLIDKDEYKVGDSLLLNLPDQKIKSHFKLEKGAQVFLIGGKHAGALGSVEDISGQKIIFKGKSSDSYETAKKYAFVVGKDKPMIKLE